MLLRTICCIGLLIFSSNQLLSQPDTILFFVSYEDTYYSEYIVMREALEAAGYFVDVRSAADGYATAYTVGGDIPAQADGLGGSSYSVFQTQFVNMFGQSWNAGFNPVPDSIMVDGSIMDVSKMQNYVAMVVAGGTGVTDYRIDGSYAGQRDLNASEIEAAAEKLNTLAAEALQWGIPVMGQCHGASLPAFWRVPGTFGNGFDGLGNSLLEGSIATGYPEAATATHLGNLNINFRADDKVVVGTPHNALPNHKNGAYKLMTTRDWYPQTVAHAAKTLINMLGSYPQSDVYSDTVSVLIIHGGAVDVFNCGAGNHSNDIPCNYGNDSVNLPADYTDLVALFQSASFPDSFHFDVYDVDLYGILPFDTDNEAEILSYLENYEVVFFYKHWSDSVTTALQNAIVSYADNGGGVVSIHHGLYNENKNILVNELFEAHSPAAGWGGAREDYNIFQTNYGHFVSTFEIINDGVAIAPGAWAGNPLPTTTNQSLSLIPYYAIFDERYTNMQFVGGVSFGDSTNQINLLFSNDQTPSGQCHVHGFTKLFDGNDDGIMGRLVYGQAGETIANYQYPHPYAQFMRNAVFWAANKQSSCAGNNVVTWTASSGNWEQGSNWSTTFAPDICSEVIIPDQPSEISVTLPMQDIEIKLLEVGLNVNFNIPAGYTFSVNE